MTFENAGDAEQWVSARRRLNCCSSRESWGALRVQPIGRFYIFSSNYDDDDDDIAGADVEDGDDDNNNDNDDDDSKSYNDVFDNNDEVDCVVLAIMVILAITSMITMTMMTTMMMTMMMKMVLMMTMIVLCWHCRGKWSLIGKRPATRQQRHMD